MENAVVASIAADKAQNDIAVHERRVFHNLRDPIFLTAVKRMQYGIREIVDTAQKIKGLDPTWEIIPENIGDPIPKGWPVPPF